MPPIARRLAGKTALVTGASRGIGRAVAERFAAEGAAVAIAYRDDAAGAEETLAALEAIALGAGEEKSTAIAIEADMADEAAVSAMVAKTIERFGRLDILVNNAGMQVETPGDTFSAARLERVLAVNLTGAAIACREVIAHFLSRPGGGAIINTTSVHEIIPKPGYLAYAASKAGLGHLTRTLALEYAARGIRVNAVGPGAVTTAMNDSWKDDPAARAAVESHIPMGRAASPEEMAPVYAFLASEEAGYITGQTIFACGGLTLYGEFAQNWSS